MDLQPVEATILLCAVCLAIRENPDTEYEEKREHHDSKKSLLKSVEEGCFFCKSLWNTAKETDKKNPTKKIITYYRLSKWDDDAYNLSLYSWDPDSGMRWSTLLYAQDLIKAVVNAKKTEPEAEKPQVLPHYDTGLFNNWSERCDLNDTNHMGCHPVSSMFPPRLLDLGEKNSTSFKLVTTEGFTPSKTFYATLSHATEAEKELKLTEATKDRLIAGCQDTDVYDNVRHAIQIARAASLQYMWIAHLCVQQDSEAEFMNYTTYMCDWHIFSSLHLVDSSAPPKPVTDISDDAFIHLAKQVSWSGSARDYIVIHDDWWEHNVESLPILQRPENFAQSVLAGKILYFDHWSGQLFFDCRHRLGRSSSIFPTAIPAIRHNEYRLLHRMVGECLTRNIITPETRNTFDPTPFVDLFNQASSCFGKIIAPTVARGNSLEMPDVTSLSLASSAPSHQTIVPAVASAAGPNPLLQHMAPFARLHQIYTKTEYYAGMLIWQIPYNLTWFVAEDHMPVSDLPTTRIVSNPPTPSWSWASVAAPHSLGTGGREWGLIELASGNQLASTNFLGGPSDSPGSVDEQAAQFKGAEWQIWSKVLPCCIAVVPQGWVHSNFTIDGHELSRGTYRLYPDVKPGVQETKEYGLIPIVYKLARGYYSMCYCLVVEKAGEDRQTRASEDGIAYTRLGLAILEDEAVKQIVEPFGLNISDGGVEVDAEKFEAYGVKLRLV